MQSPLSLDDSDDDGIYGGASSMAGPSSSKYPSSIQNSALPSILQIQLLTCGSILCGCRPKRTSSKSRS